MKKTLNSIKRCGIKHIIMKYFYLIHYDDDIQDLLSFTFGFNGYIDTLNGLQKNIINNNI